MSSRVFRAACALLAVASIPSLLAQRIASISTNRVAIPGSISHLTAGESDLGPVAGSTVLPSMSLVFKLSAAQENDLTALLAAQQNPASPLYHQWLTPESYAQRFGMSDADLATASQWLTAQGLQVTGLARSRNAIFFTGTVDRANAAFGTSLSYAVDSTDTATRRIVNTQGISLPQALASTTLTVTGLDDLRPRRQYRATSGGNYLVPGDLQTIYDARALISGGTNGAGVTIVVTGQAAIDTSYVTTFRSLSNLPAKTTTVKTYGTPLTSSGDVTEAYADVEWAGALAPSADIVFATSDNVYTSLQNAVDNNLGAIVTFSYGSCEKALSASNISYVDDLARQANALGMTVVASSGDAGATGCETAGSSGPTSATTGLNVVMPASSAYVTAVGGTNFNDAGGSYWNSSNNTDYSSVKGYIPETAWNDAGSTYHLFASGGGVSKSIAKPAWQTGTGVPSGSYRYVPDVSLVASSHTAYNICIPGFCTNGFASSTGATYVISGTSVAAPAWAGALALLVQKTGARLGNANPKLYGLASGTNATNVFHDIVSGDNKMPCTAGSTDCASGGTIGYSAGAGYDEVTGLGTPDVGGLVNYWSSGSSTTTPASIATTTTLTISSSSAILGNTLTMTAQVAGASGTTAPSGVVYFKVNGVTASTSNLSGGIATASITVSTANGFISGDNIVTAMYSGDTTYLASTSSDAHVTAATAPATFTLTPATSTLAVASGATGTKVFTVTGSNGYAGTIAFTVYSLTSGLQSCPRFSNSSVTLSSTAATATTTLSLKASSCGTSSAVKTLADAAPQHNRSHPFLPLGGGIVAAGLALVLVPRRRAMPWLLAILLTVTVASATGCGKQTEQTIGTGGNSPIVNATAGTYTLLVKAAGTNSSGTITSFATMTLTVN